MKISSSRPFQVFEALGCLEKGESLHQAEINLSLLCISKLSVCLVANIPFEAFPL